jgi:F-type H+-transporting ATPase subunit a
MTFAYIKPLDPFHEALDGYHWGFFETAGIEFTLPPWLSKFMVLEAIAFVLILGIFIPACRRIAKGGVPKGPLANGVEALMLFIRDQVAIPSLGDDYKRFMPFLWTLFVFILIVNLLGLVPFMGSATASMAVTGALALVAFVVIHYNGIKSNHGLVHYIGTFRIHLERDSGLMKVLAPIVEVGVFLLEIMGAFIRGVVLAVRLFANMMAGHTTLFVILSFISMIGQATASVPPTADEVFFWLITPASVITVIMLSMLELFVACLQAFVFVFLTATFLGMAMHPEH